MQDLSKSKDTRKEIKAKRELRHNQKATALGSNLTLKQRLAIKKAFANPSDEFVWIEMD